MTREKLLRLPEGFDFFSSRAMAREVRSPLRPRKAADICYRDILRQLDRGNKQDILIFTLSGFILNLSVA